MEDEPLKRVTKHKKHPLRKLVLIIFMTLIALGAGYAARLYSQTKTAIDKTYTPVRTKAAALNSNITGKKPISILLMGTDTGEFGRKDKGHSDTMILVTLNPKNKRTTMTSVPRDTMAEIIGGDSYDVEKINAAYTIGGSEASIKTVEKLLNVPVNYYVTVNMAGLVKIVDAVGGVNVNVPFSWKDPHYTYSSFKKGPAHLNGKRALAFARMRYEDPQGDYGRQKRQQQVIMSIVKSALSTKSLMNYQALMDSLSASMRTDLKFDDMVAIAEHYRDCAKDVKRGTVKGLGAYVDGGAYQIPSTKTLQGISDNLRAELDLEPQKLDNINVRQNKLNTDAGFNWKDYNNPNFTLYPQSKMNK